MVSKQMDTVSMNAQAPDGCMILNGVPMQTCCLFVGTITVVSPSNNLDLTIYDDTQAIVDIEEGEAPSTNNIFSGLTTNYGKQRRATAPRTY